VYASPEKLIRLFSSEKLGIQHKMFCFSTVVIQKYPMGDINKGVALANTLSPAKKYTRKTVAILGCVKNGLKKRGRKYGSSFP
jgi:hypothetical protein